MATQPTTSSGMHMARFKVKSSDVISDMRVYVSDAANDKIRWYKERFLFDDEIVEHKVENSTSTICWSVHRPKRGWYIRLRAPSFPKGVMINLAPLEKGSPFHADAALAFSCRANVPVPSRATSPQSSASKIALMSQDDGSTSSVHSYPPSPAAPVTSPGLEGTQERTPPSVPSTHIQRFLLTPHSHVHVPEPAPHAGFLAKALRVFQNSISSHSLSFTLSPIPPANTGTTIAPPPPSSPTSELPSVPPHHRHAPGSILTPTPLLIFHDHTPTFDLHAITGILEIDNRELQRLGVDISFWIAMSLTYLEFLSERESYLAASAD